MITYAYIITGSEATDDARTQVDLKTFHQLDAYGMGTLTCIVSVNPKNDFNHRFVPIAPELIHDQVETALGIRDIDTVKIGMLGTPETTDVIEEGLKSQEWKNVILDPMLIYKDGELGASTDEALEAKVLPLVTVTTPNYSEACTLAGMEKLKTIEDMTEAVRGISALGPKHVVVKGGVDFLGPDTVDLLWDGERATMFAKPKIGEYKVSSAGRMLTAVVTAELAKGIAVKDAVRVAKDMVTTAIEGRVPARTTCDQAWQGAYRG